MKIISLNRKAHRNYTVFETFEAGIVLKGTEVKSIRDGKANISDGYAKIMNNEIFLVNCHIDEYVYGNISNHNPLRQRKLLLHKREIKKLIGKVEEKGFTIIPLKLFFKEGKVKIDIALCKGKKIYDKRDDIKDREINRTIQRALKMKQK